jgi:uncharacterized delta-60 repeat protein
MKKLVLLFGVAATLAACNSIPKTLPLETGVDTSTGLAQVSISLNPNGGGEATMSRIDPKLGKLQLRTATPINNPSFSTFFTRQAVGFHDDDTGVATGGVPTRYVYATFKINNNTATNFNNLTFWGMNVSGGSPLSQFGTMYSSLSNGAGTVITDGNVFRGIIPTHGMTPNRTGTVKVNKDFADLQFFSSVERSTLGTQISSVYPTVTASNVLGYGFVARRQSDGARTINATETGLVTFAFKLPLTVSPRQNTPFSFNFIFAYGNETDTRRSQSLEEQADNTVRGDPITGTTRLLATSQRTFVDNAIENLCQVDIAIASGIAFNTPVRLPATVTSSNGDADNCFKAGGVTRDSNGESEINGAVTSGLTDLYMVGKSISNSVLVIRYNSISGDLINSTGLAVPGTTAATGHDILVDGNSKLIIVGNATVALPAAHTEMFVARLNADLTLDATFDGDGFKLITDNTSIEVTGTRVDSLGTGAARTYFFGGTKNGNFFVAKTNSTGILDTTFSSDGMAEVNDNATETLAGLDAISNSEILLAGTKNNAGIKDWLVAKLNSNGALFTAFNGTGKSLVGFGTSGVEQMNDMVVDASGSIIMGGSTVAGGSLFLIGKMTSAGVMDTTFDTDGFFANSPCDGFEEGFRVRVLASGNYVLTGTAFVASGSGATATSDANFAARSYNGSTGAVIAGECTDIDNAFSEDISKGAAYSTTTERLYMVGTSAKVTALTNPNTAINGVRFQ